MIIATPDPLADAPVPRAPPPENIFETDEGLALLQEVLHANADVIQAQRRKAEAMARLMQLRAEQQEAA